MAAETVLQRLLHHTQQLMSLSGPDEILGHSGRVALELTGARRALASYALPGPPWLRGVALDATGEPREIADAARSAMFAIHRKLAGQREPMTLELDEAAPAIFAGLALAPGSALYAVPLVQRTGRLWGEIVLVFDGTPGLVSALGELAASAMGALDHAQRLAFARRDQDRLLQRRHLLHVDVPRAGLEVSADRARLAQAISNLLNNAAKYTEPEGQIRVTAAREGDEVVISIRDNGIGIFPEMLPTVFEMFVQERQALDRARGGLGLGLSIARELVHLHGGALEAASEGIGHGSELTLRLPAQGEPAAP